MLLLLGRLVREEVVVGWRGVGVRNVVVVADVERNPDIDVVIFQS